MGIDRTLKLDDILPTEDLAAIQSAVITLRVGCFVEVDCRYMVIPRKETPDAKA
jgi:hypothetical protein